MSATSITEEDKNEKIEDDISKQEVVAKKEKPQENSMDMDKLAALKAKSQKKQKKQEEQEMASKIVSKKERSLSLGIIGSGQAGCIDGNSNIYTSKYGIGTIKELFYNELNLSELSNIEITGDNQTCISLKDKDIYTISIDPETGNFLKKKVLAVWKNRKKIACKLTTSSGSSLLCSKTHPTLVFRPNSRRKAFFSSMSSSMPLSDGDRIFDTRNTVLDQISSEQKIMGVSINKDVAWLLGLFAGDGNSSISSNAVSFYVDNDYVEKKVYNVVNNIPHTSISSMEKPGCKQICIYGLKAKLFFEKSFEKEIKTTYGGIGNKTYTISIPSCISLSYSDVRVAFISGLIDSDGTVCEKWCETSLYTTSNKLADQFSCLISSIGGRSCVETIPPRRENEKVGFRIRLSGKINHGPLFPEIIKNMSHSIRKERMITHINNKQKSFSTSSIPLKFSELKYWMQKDSNMTTVNNLYEKSGVHIKLWSNEQRQLSIPSFHKMIDSLDECEQLNYVKNISDKLNVLTSVEEITDNEYEFFDLTIEDTENYIAGNNGFVVTHNSRIAESFYKLGYDAVAINTAIQDLKYIDIPDSNKLLLEYGLGGAAKETEIGKEAAEAHRGEIAQLINDKLSTALVNVLCLSLGGGSGAGSCETLVDLLASSGKPLVVITVLPMDTEDAQTKYNALETLSKLSALTQSKQVNNLIVVDNAKIESIYQHVSQVEFYPVANKAIVEPIDVFNTLSSMPSAVKGLDPMEWGKLFTDGDGLTIYGELTVENFEEETAIAEAVINNLNGNLLAGGFDLKQSKYVGVIIAANKKVWEKIPSASVNYAMAIINDQCGTPRGVYKGIYTVDSPEDVVKVYSVFAGLGLPESRVTQLKKDAKEHMKVAKSKDDNRNMTLKLDTGVNETVSEAQKIKDKIAKKSSAFGRLVGGTVSDRRK